MDRIGSYRLGSGADKRRELGYIRVLYVNKYGGKVSKRHACGTGSSEN